MEAMRSPLTNHSIGTDEQETIRPSGGKCVQTVFREAALSEMYNCDFGISRRSNSMASAQEQPILPDPDVEVDTDVSTLTSSRL